MRAKNVHDWALGLKLSSSLRKFTSTVNVMNRTFEAPGPGHGSGGFFVMALLRELEQPSTKTTRSARIVSPVSSVTLVLLFSIYNVGVLPNFHVLPHSQILEKANEICVLLKGLDLIVAKEIEDNYLN